MKSKLNIANISHFASTKFAAVEGGLSRLHWWVSICAIPLCIALLSIISVTSWDNLYEARSDGLIDFQYYSAVNDNNSPASALQRTKSGPTVKSYDTHLSEVPVWFTFSVPPADGHEWVIEFPSRHAVGVECWNQPDLRLLGRASASQMVGSIFPVKTGYALKISDDRADILCRSSFVGPGKLTVELWTSRQLEISGRNHQRTSGLSDGGMLLLAIFLIVTAIINRNSLYLLFATWLLITMRFSGAMGGWDDQWLNHAVPTDWLPQARRVTRAIWALLLVTIFKALFLEELKYLKRVWIINLAQNLCLMLMVSALALASRFYFPLLWVVGGIVFLVLSINIFSIITKKPSRAASLYAISFAITLLSTLAELFSAAFGARWLESPLNNVAAALTSGLLAALAIAEHIRHEHRLMLDAKAELQHTFDVVPVGLFSLDGEGRIIGANPAMNIIMGLPPSVVLERQLWSEFFSQDNWAQIQELVQLKDAAELEVRGVEVPGSVSKRAFQIRVAASQGKIEGTLQDITDKVLAAEHLTFLADHDWLTHSLSRRGIEHELESAMVALQSHSPSAIAYLDLDHFRLVNDLYGRSAGDEVLKHVCSRVNNVLTDPMCLGRLGGDEFLIVMPNTRIELAALICDRILDALGGRPYDVGDNSFHVRGSIGLIELKPETPLKDAISTAGRACRQAKKHNGHRVATFKKGSPEFSDYETEIMLAELLAKPEATHNLYLVMQPIMSLAAPFDSLNFEVLLRMRDQAGRPVRTDHLIKAAEGSGRMGMIDRWVLNTTLEWLNTHYRELSHTKFICMNLSSASLNDERFVEDAVNMLNVNQHVAHHLCYEITESVALHDLANTRRFIDRVRSFGAKVALDDFGAGYTSFSYLKDLPADLLKIDGSFIVDMNQHPANVAIVEAIVNLAGNLGMKTIAEWAEDIATVQTLKDVGVDYVQGYVVAKPQEPERLLTASSSASFINNPSLMGLVNGFSKSGGVVPEPELFYRKQ